MRISIAAEGFNPQLAVQFFRLGKARAFKGTSRRSQEAWRFDLKIAAYSGV
jgi:hypothetical protein